MIKLFSLALLPCLLLAEITTSSISSDRASYDGSALVLSGDVQLDHALGKMESAEARLMREDPDGPFSTIHLHDGVQILLKNHGRVLCHVADFDFNTMAGKLLSKRGEKIRFVNIARGITLSSVGAHILFSRKFDELKIAKIIAESSVDVEYGPDFSLTADGATYIDDQIHLIEATPNCTLTHFDDLVTADKIQLFPDSSKVILEAPRGNLRPTVFSDTAAVSFSCDKLIWERAPQLLTLHGHILVEDDVIGTIESDDEVELRQKLQEEKWMVSSILAKGKTTLCYRGQEELDHTLISHGGMNLDGERFVLTAERSDETPITYLHDGMTLEADYAQLDYAQGVEGVTPEKLFLSGSIRLANEGDHLRCALADQFVYKPDSKTMILTAKNGERVLFWDEEQHLSISAKEVHITKTDRGEKVKGVGNVRFAFSSTESTLLKKLFPFYQPKGETP